MFGGNAGRLEIEKNAVNILKDYGWPGNVRELKNIIERFSILNIHNRITEKDVMSELKIQYPAEKENNGVAIASPANVIESPVNVIASEADGVQRRRTESSEANQSPADDSSLDFESYMAAGSFKQAKEYFEKAYLIRKLKENNNNITRTAQILGMSRRNLQKRINCLNINQ